ncbi:MAG TPA: response regulator [Chitinophagaceae bacterium]|jgi:CheY-like chemotaxis protein
MYTAQPKIFLVEDNPVYQTLILKQLESISQDIQVFSKGESFLSELSGLTIQPDLVILDYHLEGVINGYDILKHLKQMPSPPPVIFFSSNLELTITSSILKLGIVEYIEKTIFSLSRLKESTNGVLKDFPGRISASPM